MYAFTYSEISSSFTLHAHYLTGATHTARTSHSPVICFVHCVVLKVPGYDLCKVHSLPIFVVGVFLIWNDWRRLYFVDYLRSLTVKTEARTLNFFHKNVFNRELVRSRLKAHIRHVWPLIRCRFFVVLCWALFRRFIQKTTKTISLLR